jgi:hypothetical protein
MRSLHNEKKKENKSLSELKGKSKKKKSTLAQIKNKAGIKARA